MKPLIAYYSRAGENYFAGTIRSVPRGNTSYAAEYIADALDAPMIEIRQKSPYSDDYKECVAQASADWKSGARPEIDFTPTELDCDVLFLCYPNYCGTVPMAVMTFLERYDLEGVTIAPLCTNEGSGMGSSVNDIRVSAPGAKIAEGMPVTGGRVRESKDVIVRWAASLMDRFGRTRYMFPERTAGSRRSPIHTNRVVGTSSSTLIVSKNMCISPITLRDHPPRTSSRAFWSINDETTMTMRPSAAR